MPKVPGVIPSAAAGVPYHSAKRTHLEYSTVAKTVEKFQQNDKNNVKKITSPSYNSQKFTERSKRQAMGALNKKIGCSWTQFTGDIDVAIDHVALSIDDKYVSYQHEKTAKIAYFMFYNEESAEKCMNTPIYYNGKAVELYQTVTLEEGMQIITIPSTNSINIRMVVEAVNNTFTKNGIIYDFSAYKNKRSVKFHTFGMKFFKAQKQPTSQEKLAENSKRLDKSDENYTENNVSVAVIDMDLVNELADNNDFTDAEISKIIISETA
ncbi:hypothetical protein BB561_004550 [Smittium simulii]|uniref:Uncharacterized protein n=1 Tax=Smittium simulii TaxID=133385 RepID=A0A2T9YFN0_9FUNG|nr:hypothetical protein BB561_004550 [Smittium simulii]